MAIENKDFNNFMKMRWLILNNDLKIIDNLNKYSITRFLKKQQVKSLVKYNDRLRSILGGKVYFSNKDVKTNSNRDRDELQLISSNLFNDPYKKRQADATFLDDSKMEFNMIYDNCSQLQRDNLHAYMTTLSVQSVNKGLLDKIFRGEKSKKSQKLLNSYKEMTRKLVEKIMDEYHVIAGITSYEITINKDKLKAHDGTNLFHIHTHLMLISDQEIGIDRIKLHNGRYLNINNFIMNEWSKICKHYDKKTHSHSRKFNHQAFDIREAYSKNSNANFSDTLTEELKYSIKPDYLSTMKEMDDELKDGGLDDFALEVFAELMGATYRNPAKLRFGLLNELHQVNQGSSTLKSVVKTAINSNPKFNISNSRTFTNPLTKVGKITYVNGKNRSGYWRHCDIHDMDDKEMLVQNSGAIRGILMSDEQLSWLKQVISGFDVDKLNGTKKQYFDSVLNFFDRLPYINSVDGLNEYIDGVANGYAIEAIKNQDNHDSYKYYMNKFNDLHHFSKAIKKYVDNKGVVRLGLHTSPKFKYRVSKWVSIFLGSIKSGFSEERMWYIYAAMHNGYADVVGSLPVDEKNECRRAMNVADSMFNNYMEVAPQPREVASFDHIGCYFKVDVSHLGSGKELSDTGELITNSDYGKLTAPSFDKQNWSEAGIDFDINLFADLSSFGEVAREIRHAMAPLIKKYKSSIHVDTQLSFRLNTKKMANA